MTRIPFDDLDGPTTLEEPVRDENSTYCWLMEEMLRRAGFKVQDASYSDDGFFARYVARST